MNDIQITKNGISTIDISVLFKKPSYYIVGLINKYKESFLQMGNLIYIREHSEIAGRPKEGYYINKGQLLLLVSFFRTTDISIKARIEIIKLYNKSIDNLIRIEEALKDFDFDDFQVKYVYVAEDSKGRVKIGISNNPKQRLKQLNIGNADNLKLIYVKKSKNEKYEDETMLHNKCSQYRIRGEWFNPEAKEILKEECYE